MQIENTNVLIAERKHPLVLVVDDEPAIAEMLEMLLEEDYEVNTCLYSNKAFEQAQVLQPDLLIIDLMMPNMNGFELLKKMRSQPELTHIPAILMTASASLVHLGIDEASLIELKASLVKKPFDNNKLLTLLKEL